MDKYICIAENSPILHVDLDGGEKKPYYDLPKHSANTQLEVINHTNVYTFTELNTQYKVAEYGTQIKDPGPFNQQYPRSVYMVRDEKGVNNSDYIVGDGTIIRTKGTNWHFWKTSNDRSTAGQVTDDLLRKTGIAVFGGAVAGTGVSALTYSMPFLVNAGRAALNYSMDYGSKYLSTAFKAQMMERLASSSADALMQYAGNVPNYGFGLKNIGHINVSSVALNFAAPGSNAISGFGGSALEFNFSNGYQGLGSGNKSFGAVMIQGAIGTGGNYMGNKIGGVVGKYGNVGIFLNSFTGNVLGNGTSNTIQNISDQMSASNEKPK